MRDLSDFIIKLVEEKASGIYNATGPDYELTLGAMLQVCKEVSSNDANFKWASVEFLNQNNVAAWSDLPVWLPSSGDEMGVLRANISKAIQAGLKFRPLEETVRDTLEWAKEYPVDHVWKAGLTPEREAELLKLMR